MSETQVDNSKSKLLVEAIANGTVIDHIAPGQGINIIRMFQFLRKNAQSRNRTSDTRIFSPLLYQLSYLG